MADDAYFINLFNHNYRCKDIPHKYEDSDDGDDDGLTDANEIDVYGTDPTNPDSDGDGLTDGDEIANSTDPLYPTDANATNSRAVTDAEFLDLLEVGDIQIDHNWIRVNFAKPFLNPVVVTGPLSLNGLGPAVIRIRNVDSNGFDIRLQEWD